MVRNRYPIIAALALIAVVLSACAPAAAAANNGATPTIGSGSAPNGGQNTAPNGGTIQINAAGGTFPLPIYTEWTYAYQSVDPSVTVNYQGIGSGGGKKAIIDNTVDFAGSDALLTDAEYASGKDLQMYPALAGAVVLVYNVTGLTASDPALILDRQTLVAIYNATITKWNDPAILALNPQLKDKLPDKAITAVHRSDGSGTTEIFTRALSSFSPDWKAGGAQSVQWPVDKAGSGIGGKGNPGVAAAVQNTPYSLGYVELDYAIANKIPYAQMVNKAGKTVTADAASLAAAMNDFASSFTPQLTNTIVDAPGAGSWPIAGYTYYILHATSMTDCTKAQKILQYIAWTLTDPSAAKMASDLGYAALPDAVRQQVLSKLDQVTCKGQPVLTTK